MTINRDHYPTNVCVHGNGFIQISLGGQPLETRIHIFDKRLEKLCQQVNTRFHNHRFGFVSTVLFGQISNETLEFVRDERGEWVEWKATGSRMACGNRMLMQQDGFHRMKSGGQYLVHNTQSYMQDSREYHISHLLSDVAVTLMVKTEVLPVEDFMASVMCRRQQKPDTLFNRYQIPWPVLRDSYINPALAETPFGWAKPDQLFVFKR